MPITNARRTMDAELSEKDWQQQIINCAEQNGWLIYHTRDSRGSAYGFPDLVLVKPPRVLFWECKTEDEKKSKPTEDQKVWIRELKLCRAVYADIVRPHHWDQVEAALR